MSSAEIAGAIVQYRWIVCGITTVFLVLSLLAAFLLPKTYRAETVLIAVETDGAFSGSQLFGGQLGGLASLANIDLGGGSQKDEAIAILKSRRFTTEFINALDLMPVMFSDEWDAKAKTWKLTGDGRSPSLWDGVEKFDQDIRSITENRQSGIITLSVKWTDPAMAADWANQLVEKTNRIVRQGVIEHSEKGIEFLMRELDSTKNVEIRHGIYSLIEHHTQRKMLANVQEEYAFKVIDPAIAPDLDDYVSPQRLLIVIIGTIFGITAGFFVALVVGYVQRARQSVVD